MNLLDTAKVVALEAGALLKNGFGSDFSITHKEGKHNLVTEYDIATQKLIIERIKQRHPTHKFLAEEDNISETGSDEILWIIDPLDGTVNFSHGIPIFGVSIAAVRNTEVLAGAVYNPMLNELFYAERGKGAHLGEKKLKVSEKKHLEGAFVATGFPYDVDQNPLGCIDRFSVIAKTGIPIRRMGCASIDLAYVAAGRFDLFWEVGLHPWDMAAGKLLVEEAGGMVTAYDGSLHPLFGYHPIIASNGHLHAEMTTILKEDLQ